MELLVKVGIDLGTVRLRIGILGAIGKITIAGNIVTLGKSDYPFADRPMSLPVIVVRATSFANKMTRTCRVAR